MTCHHTCVTRRDFLKGTVGATLAASVLHPSLHGMARAASPSSDVTIVRHEAVLNKRRKVDQTILAAMLDETVMHVTGESSAASAWKAIATPTDVVGLVPTPHLNPTHIEVVDLVTAALVKYAGLPPDNILKAQGGLRRPKRCTVLISLPGLKAHWLTGVGTVLKNYIMYSGRPTRYHAEKSSRLGEIWLLPEVKDKTRLILVDALYPLCDKGPQPDPRYQWHYNGLIAGTDPVAVESVGLKIITEKRNQLRGEPWPLSPPPICVEAADKVYGLGNSDWAKIKVHHHGWDTDRLV